MRKALIDQSGGQREAAPGGDAGKTAPCWTMVSLSRILLPCPARFGGFGLERGDSSETGGVPMGRGHIEGQSPDLELSSPLFHSPRLMGCTPRPQMALAKGRGTWGAWGGLSGPGGH